MQLRTRQNIAATTALLLLSLFFGLFYQYISIRLEDYSQSRVQRIADYSAALLDDWLSSYARAVGLVITLAPANFGTRALFSGMADITGPKGKNHLNVALKLDTHGLALIDHGNTRFISPENERYALWMQALEDDGTPLKGPLPSLDAEDLEILFVHALRGRSKRKIGTLAIRIPLRELADKMHSLNILASMGRRLYLTDAEGKILQPALKTGAPLPIREDPALCDLPEAVERGKGTAVPYQIDDTLFYAAGASVGETGWRLYLLSPVSYEMSVQFLLRMAFGGAWVILCAFIIAVLYLARKHEHYKRLSEKDHLTGTGNRLAFEKAMARLSHEKTFPVSMIVIDIDGLKRINDALGHKAGDALLQRTAKVLQRSLREGDAVYRLGGDEFAVVIPGATLEIARQLADRIADQAAQARQDRILPPVFISQGLADASDDNDLATLLNRADEGMYACKNKSRAMVSLAIQEWIERHPVQVDRRAGQEQ